MTHGIGWQSFVLKFWLSSQREQERDQGMPPGAGGGRCRGWGKEQEEQPGRRGVGWIGVGMELDGRVEMMSWRRVEMRGM